MSFWHYIFNKDYRDKVDLEELRKRSRKHHDATATNESDDPEARVRALEERVGELQIMNRVLLRYMRNRTDWAEDEFYHMVHDANLDGEDESL